MIHIRLFIIGFLVLMFTSGATLSESDNRPVGISIRAEPIFSFNTKDSSQRLFGSLEFRGGLVLSSSNKSFGGFSALKVQPDGEHFIAVSDRSSWLRGRIVYKGKQPVDIADAMVAPVLEKDGKPDGRLDTESIAEDSKRLYVGLERTNQILCFLYDKRDFPVYRETVEVPPEIKDLPFNQGLEALVFIPKKYPLGRTLLAFSEKGLTKDGDLKSFLIGGPRPGSFAVKRTQDYDISDAALMPDGSVLILERKYSVMSGVNMRIRRIPLADIKPNALVDGPAVIEADGQCQIDNMEALSVHRTRAGEIVLTLMSDDNFSPIQRTILLQFTFMGK
jgi:hypothetical protein